MNIIYVASTCSDAKYQKYIESKGLRVSQQAQKYNLLLAEGLAEQNVHITLLSTRPVNRIVDKKIWYTRECEVVKGVNFVYLSFVNFPVLRQLFILFNVFFSILFENKSKKDTVVLCDVLNVVAAFSVIIASFFKGYRTVGIVTDVPGHLSYSKKMSILQYINLLIIRKYSSYLFLTQHMNDLLNEESKPYIVMEGHADIGLAIVKNIFENKDKKRICLYAGTLMKIYGIDNLVKGFLDANIPNTELHIYGNGEYANELEILAKKFDTVKFFGVVSNKEVVEAEIKATLLVNPRPTDEDYTRYSFPSKNMEYMASGTPVLTTKLPGMPVEYYEYVYLIEDESVRGISESFKGVFSHSDLELFQMGKKAKEFILREKNNIKQAEQLVNMIKRVL